MNPVFHETEASLKASVRMTGAKASDAVAIFGDAVMHARIRIYERLGESRVNQIKGTAVSQNATTPAQITRLRSLAAESALVRAFLISRIPMAFIDSSAQVLDAWNEVPLHRSESSQSKAMQAAESEAEVLLSQLVEDDAGETSGFRIMAVSPAVAPPKPLASIKRGGIGV